MDRVSPIEFARNIQEVCDQFQLIAAYDVRILDDTVVKVRVFLIPEMFIDVFYNEDTGKKSYALINKGCRIFGADNAFIGWHLHPFDNPDEHIPSSEISFIDFMETVKKHLTPE